MLILDNLAYNNPFDETFYHVFKFYHLTENYFFLVSINVVEIVYKEI